MNENSQIANHKLEVISKTLADPIFIKNVNGDYLDVIGGIDKEHYANPKSLVGQNINNLIIPQEVKDIFFATIKRALKNLSLEVIEYRLDNEDLITWQNATEEHKGEQWYQGRVCPLNSSIYGQDAVVWLAINITDSKLQQRRHAGEMAIDTVTGLPNQVYSMDNLNEAIKSIINVQGEKFIFSVAIFEISNIKHFHQTMKGDEVETAILQFFTNNLQKIFTQDIAQIGLVDYNKFIVIMPEVDLNGAISLAKQFNATLNGNSLKSGCCILSNDTNALGRLDARKIIKHLYTNLSKTATAKDQIVIVNI